MDYPSSPSIRLLNGKFTDGDPSQNVPASLDPAAHMNAITDELLALITDSGQNPAEGVLTQILEAVRRYAGAHVTPVAESTALTAAHAGLVLVDASAGNVDITLPASGTLASLAYRFQRVDTSANTVTVQRAGTDTIDGAATHPLDVFSALEMIDGGLGEWFRLGRRVGAPFMWPGSTPPAGALKLNGAAVSRTAYKRLFQLLGTTYGAGDGSTTFNLPDDRGEFWRALDDGRGVDSGRVLGSAQADELKSHTHIWDGLNPFVAGSAGVASGSVKWGADNVTDPTGGAETRPRNRAYLACISY